MIKVLIIEANDDVRENIVEILLLEGFLVSNASTSKAGMALALLILPNVILCDLIISSPNGNGLLDNIRNNPSTASIPLIFITSQCENPILRKSVKSHSSQYLVKPFGGIEMISAINAIVAK